MGNISLRNPYFEFIEGNTLIFFDELQDCINCATSLKSFKMDGRFDVICSGSLMGINYNEIESNSVGYKEDYEMYSLDFEEYLWAKGYKEKQIETLFFIFSCTSFLVMSLSLHNLLTQAFASKLLCKQSALVNSPHARGTPLLALPMLHCISCTFPSVSPLLPL